MATDLTLNLDDEPGQLARVGDVPSLPVGASSPPPGSV